jgi:hypothetical protein
MSAGSLHSVTPAIIPDLKLPAMQLKRVIALSTMLLIAPVGVAQATTSTTPPAPAPEAAPTFAPESNGGVTVTVLGVHPSVPANAVVVVAEVTTEIQLEGSNFAVYVTPSGQQFETDEYFDINDTVFPGVSRVVAWSFDTAETGGTVHWSVYGEDFEDIEFSLPLS